MPINLPKKIIAITISASVIFLCRLPLIFAENLKSGNNKGYIVKSAQISEMPAKKKFSSAQGQESEAVVEKKELEHLSELQKMARQYRAKGLEEQRAGELDAAMTYYQKAVDLDPLYAVAYNDLGVVFEAKADPQRAELAYLKATMVDPNYLSAYSNLALLYENKRELAKAAFYWKKRIELGYPGDPWTEKAKLRLEDIQAVIEPKSPVAQKQDEVVNLIREVADQKTLSRKDEKYLAKEHFEKAKLCYQKGDEVTAFKEAIDAQSLDPANSEVNDFLEKLQIRLLSK